MEEFFIKRINNGWILQGPHQKENMGRVGLQANLFLPTVHAVADIFQTWHFQGFAKAFTETKEKYGGKNG